VEHSGASAKIARSGIWFTLLLGSLTAFDPLSIDMYLPAFPNMGKDFAVSSAQVELSLSSFFIGLAVGQLIYGPISDRYGRKKPLLVGMGIYFLSCIACAYSRSIHMLIFFRVLQALGGCSGMVIARAIVRDVFEKQRAAQTFSMLMLVMGVAPILAPMVGGYVAEYFGWRAIFGILGTLGLLSWACTLLFLPETHPASRERPSLLSSFRATGSILRDKEFLGYTLAAGAVTAGMFAYIAGSPFVFITLLGISPERYGWIFGVNSLGLIVAAQMNSLLLKKFPLESILRVATSGTCVFAIALFIASHLSRSPVALLIPLFFFISSLGLTVPNALAGALAHQGRRAGTASSLMGTIRWSIAFLASFLVSLLHNGTSGPMTGIILASGISALLMFHLAVPTPKPALGAEVSEVTEPGEIISSE